MAKANTPSDRLADSTSFPGTSANAAEPPASGGAQDAGCTEGAGFAVATAMATRKPTRFYSTEDVAEMFGRKKRTVRRWMARGLLKRTKIGKAVFISEHEIDALAFPAEVSAGGET